MKCDLLDAENNVLETKELAELPPDDLGLKGWLWVEHVEVRGSIDEAWQRHGLPAEDIDRVGRTRTLTFPAQARPVAEVLAERMERLAAHRYDREVAGAAITLGEVTATIRTDRESQGKIDSMQRSLKDEVIASVRFKPAAGPAISADLAIANAIRAAVVAHVQLCHTLEADHADAMLEIDGDEELTDAAKAEAIGTYNYAAAINENEWP